MKNNIEIIESERYNSKDPIITLEENDSHEEIIIKLLASERTGAPLKYKKEFLDPAADLALSNFRKGVSTINSWQFKKSENHLTQAADTVHDQILQQRINLYKQLRKLMVSVVQTSPERIVKSKGKFFEDIVNSIPKYDKLSLSEQNYYRKSIDNLYKIAEQLQDENAEIRTQQQLARCSISLLNREYLAAYIWLFKIYLLNKEIFDNIAETDEVLDKALKLLRLYLEHGTGLKEQMEKIPTMASAFALKTIFIDHLSAIYDVEFLEETKKNFSFSIFRENK